MDVDGWNGGDRKVFKNNDVVCGMNHPPRH